MDLDVDAMLVEVADTPHKQVQSTISSAIVLVLNFHENGNVKRAMCGEAIETLVTA